MKKAEMNRLIVAAIAFACGLATYAMPTKETISQVQPLVNDLTASDLRALRSKEKTPGDVAATHLALADKAETEAGKYLLLQGAFRLYARGGDYDAAAVPLQRMRGEIAELPPEVIVEIVNKEMRRVAESKAPKVLAIFRDAQRTIKYRKQLASAELNATAHPENVRYQRGLAECHACLGDWPKAIEIFAKIGDEAAKWELGKAKDCDAAKAADFWWNYKAPDAEPFKAHAAALYKKGFEDGSITGLRKTLAEKRVKEMEGVMTAAPAVANTPNAAPTKRGKSIMVKIKNGIELEFIPCPAGTFTMGADKVVDSITGRTRAVTNPNNYAYKHEVKITRPFWMSKYPITVEQFGAFCPIDDEFINQNGKQGEPKAPVCLRIAAAKDYCKWLNRRFASAVPRKCIFRLPTDAEWEYALFANSTDKDDPYVRLRDGEKAALQEICGTKFPVPVGTAGKPNAWGLYDMLGNGCHYVLDTISNWYVNHGKLYGIINHEKKYAWSYSENETDPLRWYVPDVPVEKGKSARHLMRGGCYVLWAAVKGPNLYFRMPECGDINRETDKPDCPRIWTFRVVIGPDLVAEKMAGKK